MSVPDHDQTSSLQAVNTDHVRYQFRWMGECWKQEIACEGACQAIPLIWSTEGEVARDGHLTLASPSYQHMEIQSAEPPITVVWLEGHSESRRYSAVFTFEERPNELLVDVLVNAEGGNADNPLMATYLVEASDGQLETGESATIAWPMPEARLVFEAESPAQIETQKSGQGTIRLTAIAKLDPTADVQTLRYHWRWIGVPNQKIWDREV